MVGTCRKTVTTEASFDESLEPVPNRALPVRSQTDDTLSLKIKLSSISSEVSQKLQVRIDYKLSKLGKNVEKMNGSGIPNQFGGFSELTQNSWCVAGI